jgi:hypothetical protein
MKYYKDKNNQVYAYEADGSQDEFIKPSLVAITKEQADEMLVKLVPEYTPPPEPTKAELLAELAELTAKIEALGEA